VLGAGGGGRADEVTLTFHGPEGNHTVHKLSVVTEHQTEQVISFADTSAVLVTATLAADSPQVTACYFTYAAPVRPVHIESCSASPSTLDHSCDKLFDGLHSSTWIPVAGTPAPWVKLTFGSFGIEQGKAKRRLNRMNLKFSLAGGSSAVSPVARRLLEGGPREWAAQTALADESAGSGVQLGVEYEGGHKETVTLDLVTAGGAGVNVELKGGTGSEVTLTLEKAGPLLLSEVTLWYAEELTAAQRQQIETEKKASTALEELQRELVPANIADLMQVGYLDKVWDAIKEAAEIIAMGLCLAGLSIVQGLLDLVKVIFNGIASVLIWALEALIAAMGPHFFQILNLMIGGSFDALKGGEIMLEFEIDMWLFNIRIGPWGFKLIFTIANLIGALFGQAKGGMSGLRM